MRMNWGGGGGGGGDKGVGWLKQKGWLCSGWSIVHCRQSGEEQPSRIFVLAVITVVIYIVYIYIHVYIYIMMADAVRREVEASSR